MFAKLVAKYLLLIGVSIRVFNVSAMASETSSDESNSDSTFSSEQPKKKNVLSKEELFSPEYVGKVSQTYGHLIRKNLNSPNVKLNIDAVIAGIRDANEGKPSPLQDKECEEAFRLMEKYSHEELLSRNLEEAENFLKKNSQLDGVIEIQPNKLQYKVLQTGTGDLVTKELVPTINYSATYLNGISLGSSDQHGGPIEIELKETISGFRLGLLGMKVGEKRRLFIHPDLGYRKGGQSPNGLLIFDVEVIKVAQKSSSDEDSGDESTDPEDDQDYNFDDEDYSFDDESDSDESFEDDDDDDDSDEDDDDEDDEDDDDDDDYRFLLDEDETDSYRGDPTDYHAPIMRNRRVSELSDGYRSTDFDDSEES